MSVIDWIDQVIKFVGGGVYNSVKPTIGDGQRGELQIDANGVLCVRDDALRGVRKIVVVTWSGGLYDPPVGTTIRALYVGVTGDVKVTAADDSAAVVIPNLLAGMWHPVNLKQLTQSGTTATGVLVGF